ncbi:MAG: hypothetical protein BMS9Abin06_0118 [Gammaproteobacteria bacterium]|nr:MAG: hypothetical protein BMS9Abin06_0118 [Gammaproteobacteria bacterium]
MSYILEALKKAELQRDIGQVPGIGSEHEKPPYSVTGKWVWLVVAFLVLGLLLLTWLLWFDSGRDAGSRYNQASPQLDLVIQEPAQVSAPTPAPSSPPVVPPARRAAPDTPLSAAVPVVTEPVPMPAPVVESSVPAGLVTEQAQDIQPVEGTATDINSLPVWPQIPGHLFQLLRGGIRLDVHVYSDLPQDRFVLINLQKYRAGEQLQEGPLLDEITREGVILSFQGQQFRVRAQ